MKRERFLKAGSKCVEKLCKICCINGTGVSMHDKRGGFRQFKC